MTLTEREEEGGGGRERRTIASSLTEFKTAAPTLCRQFQLAHFQQPTNFIRNFSQFGVSPISCAAKKASLVLREVRLFTAAMFALEWCPFYATRATLELASKRKTGYAERGNRS